MPETKTKTAVILDAAPAQRDRLRSAVMELGYSVLCFSRESSLLDNFRSLAPRLLLIGDLEERRMLRLFYTIKSNHPFFPIVFARCDDTALQLMESNGFANVACLDGGFSPEMLRIHLDNLKVFDRALEPNVPAPIVVGHSLEMQKIRKLIREIGPSMAPVLVTGEAGTGKDLMAQAIYHDGKLPGEKLIKIDVPAGMSGRERLPTRWLPQSLGPLAAESSESSTGERPAKRCTVMIDSIDQLPLDHQEQFVEFLTGSGHNGASGDDPGQTLRLICASRYDVAALADAGRFRKDLYHLLSVFAISLPPLRMRSDDILLLADYFEGVYCLELSRTVMDICGSAKESMLTYSWPGNVAELKQLVFDALSSGTEGFLNRRLRDAVEADSGIEKEKQAPGFDVPCLPSSKRKAQTISLKDTCKTIVENTEKRIIAQALNKTSWNRRRAAQILDISYRTLLNKIKAYGLK